MITAAQADQAVDGAEGDNEDQAAVFKLLLDFDEGDDSGIAAVTTGSSKVFTDADLG